MVMNVCKRRSFVKVLWQSDIKSGLWEWPTLLMLLKFAYDTLSVLKVQLHVGNVLVLNGCSNGTHFGNVCPCLRKVIAIPYLSIKWLCSDLFSLNILLLYVRINILLDLGHAFHHQGIKKANRSYLQWLESNIKSRCYSLPVSLCNLKRLTLHAHVFWKFLLTSN